MWAQTLPMRRFVLAVAIFGIFVAVLRFLPGRAPAGSTLEVVEPGQLRVRIVLPGRSSDPLEDITDGLVRALEGVAGVTGVHATHRHWNWLWDGRGLVVVSCPLSSGLTEVAVEDLVAKQVVGRLGAKASAASVILERRADEPGAPVAAKILTLKGLMPEWVRLQQ